MVSSNNKPSRQEILDVINGILFYTQPGSGRQVFNFHDRVLYRDADAYLSTAAGAVIDALDDAGFQVVRKEL